MITKKYIKSVIDAWKECVAFGIKCDRLCDSSKPSSYPGKEKGTLLTNDSDEILLLLSIRFLTFDLGSFWLKKLLRKLFKLEQNAESFRLILFIL